MSRPVWARGLKLLTGIELYKHTLSRPVWARGLKLPCLAAYCALERRAPCGRVD